MSLSKLFKRKKLVINIKEEKFESIVLDILQYSHESLICNVVVNSEFVKGYNLELHPESEVKCGIRELKDLFDTKPYLSISIRLDDDSLPLVKKWEISKSLFLNFYSLILRENGLEPESLIYQYSHYLPVKYSKKQTITIEEFLSLSSRLLEDANGALRIKNEQR